MYDDDHIPWKSIDSELGSVPFYVIQFDKFGACTSPAALEHLLKASVNRTDVLLFSHGWNNDWAAATSRYDRFVDRFAAVRRSHWATPDRDFAPVLVGVFWPSTALVAPWEQGPDIAGADSVEADLAVLKEALDTDELRRLREILDTPAPSKSDALEAASIVARAIGSGDEEVPGDRPVQVTGEQLLETWKATALPGEPTGEPGGFIEDDEAPGPVAPEAAGFNPLDWIRKGIRLATVHQMKDRAGRVGGTGVAAMLRDLAGESDARLSLIGHSYGAKVVLSALCNGPGPSRPVDSVLLLQPALSCYAFSDSLEGRPGGYRSALDRTRQPIITSRSAHDAPLTRFFHVAVRRRSDLAEAKIAGQPPSKFAALGGYPPQDVAGGIEDLDMPAVGEDYPLATSRRMIAVNGTEYIKGHGKVEIPETAWALLSQIRR